MTEDTTPKTTKSGDIKPPSPQYTEQQLQELVEQNIQAERSRLRRVHENELGDALKRQEESLKKEFKQKLVDHTQKVRENAYDAILERMRQLFLTAQENLAFPHIIINDYNELVKEFGSKDQQEKPLL